jgi:hypothetical protein
VLLEYADAIQLKKDSFSFDKSGEISTSNAYIPALGLLFARAFF